MHRGHGDLVGHFGLGVRVEDAGIVALAGHFALVLHGLHVRGVIHGWRFFRAVTPGPVPSRCGSRGTGNPG
ncbi:hypothetical protein [Streptomyces sp. NPDC055140]